MMKLFVTFGLLSLASAELRKWPSWLPKPPIGIPRLPPWLDFNLTPARKFNGGNYHIGQPCSVQYEKHVYKGTCQKDDDFSKSAFGGCPTDVSLYGCGAQRKSKFFFWIPLMSFSLCFDPNLIHLTDKIFFQ